MLRYTCTIIFQKENFEELYIFKLNLFRILSLQFGYFNLRNLQFSKPIFDAYTWIIFRIFSVILVALFNELKAVNSDNVRLFPLIKIKIKVRFCAGTVIFDM